MNDVAITLTTLGALLLLGPATAALGRRTPLPRVILLLIFGFLMGPSVLDFLPSLGEKWFHVVADMALVMVGFLLGGKLTLPSMRRHGRLVLWISIASVVATAAVMLVGLLLVGVRLDVALLLAGIAPTTAPAATADVVHEVRAHGRFSRTLLGIVAVDDAWGLILFSLMLTAAHGCGEQGGTAVPLPSSSVSAWASQCPI